MQVFNCSNLRDVHSMRLLDLRRSFDDVHIKTHTAYIDGLLRCSGVLLQSLELFPCSSSGLVLFSSLCLQFHYIALSSRSIFHSPCLPRRCAGRRRCGRIHRDQIRPARFKDSCGWVHVVPYSRPTPLVLVLLCPH